MATVQLDATIQSEELDGLRLLAARRGLSETEALQWAIQTAVYLQRVVDEGGKVLIQRPDRSLSELVLGSGGASKMASSA